MQLLQVQLSDGVLCTKLGWSAAAFLNTYLWSVKAYNKYLRNSVCVKWRENALVALLFGASTTEHPDLPQSIAVYCGTA